MPNDAVIETTELAALPAFHLLDVRTPSAFSAGHALESVRVPIEKWEAAAKAEKTSFSNVAYWESAIRALGVDNNTLAVVYDDGRLTEAARVWFVLQYFGASAAILNGGWLAIAGVTLPTVAARSIQSFRAQPAAGKVGLVNREGLRSELGSGTRIFDARSTAEFTGEDLRNNPRGGHLPGARHLPHTSLLDGHRLRSPEELRHLLAHAGFQPGDQVVTHCDGGGRAALAAAAAVRAGYTDVRAYYLSFAHWARDESCTIVRD